MYGFNLIGPIASCRWLNWLFYPQVREFEGKDWGAHEKIGKAGWKQISFAIRGAY
jgi:hypothetical protein